MDYELNSLDSIPEKKKKNVSAPRAKMWTRMTAVDRWTQKLPTTRTELDVKIEDGGLEANNSQLKSKDGDLVPKNDSLESKDGKIFDKN